MAQIGAHSSHPTVALLLVALAGAGLGFLPFNLPPASRRSSATPARTCSASSSGTLSIRAATGPSDQIFVAVPLIALGYPILDLTLAAVRRSLQHRHPMIGDEDHIHHRLEEIGLGPRGLLVVDRTGWRCSSPSGAIVIHYIANT